MKILYAIILEIYLLVSSLQVIPLSDLNVSPRNYNHEALRRIKAPSNFPASDLPVSEMGSVVDSRFTDIKQIFESLVGKKIVETTATGFKLNLSDSSLGLENSGENGISISGTDFKSVVSVDNSGKNLTIDIPALPEGGRATAVFHPDGSAEITAEIDGRFYRAQIAAGSEPLDISPDLKIESIGRSPVIQQPVIIQLDDGNWFGENALVPFMARTERAIRNVLVTDKDGNVVTDISGNIVPVYGMYLPQLPVGNATQGPISNLQSIEDQLHEAILYVDKFIYEGDPSAAISGGKQALLAGRFYEAAQKGKLPYPTEVVAQKSTDMLYQIVRSALTNRSSERAQSPPSPGEISDIVDIIPYGLRVKLVNLYQAVTQMAISNPQALQEANLPSSPEALDSYMYSLVSALGPISVIGTILHPSQTSHDHWEGFLVRSVQLMTASIYDTRMPTMPDFLAQAIRFLWGDDRVVVFKRINQIMQSRGVTDPLVKQMVSDIQEKRNQRPAVNLPLSPGGVTTMSGSYEYSRADVRFSALLLTFLGVAKALPASWGLQMGIPPLVVGATTSLGIYALFNKVLAPVVKALKTGASTLEAIKIGAKGLLTLPKDWQAFQPLALLMPYMLAKLKLHSFTNWLFDTKTEWPKRMNPTIPLNSKEWKAYVQTWQKSILLGFERTMDIFVANAALPAAAVFYASTLYQLMGPAWMWIGLPQIFGWATFPIALNTFLKNKWKP